MLVLASVDNSMQFSFSIELVAAERDEKYSMYCLFQCTASSLLLFFLSSLLPPLLFVGPFGKHCIGFFAVSIKDSIKD